MTCDLTLTVITEAPGGENIPKLLRILILYIKILYDDIFSVVSRELSSYDEST